MAWAYSRRISRLLDESLRHGYCVLSREPACSKNFWTWSGGFCFAEVRFSGFALICYICCRARGANALSLSPQCQIGILHCQRAARKISKGHSLLIFFGHARMSTSVVKTCKRPAVGHAADMITCSFLFDLKNMNKYHTSNLVLIGVCISSYLTCVDTRVCHAAVSVCTWGAHMSSNPAR